MGYKHLTENERYQIDDLLREGFNQAEIAIKLGRSPSTLSRELHRNHGERGWRPRQAQHKAVDRLVARGTNNARKISEAAWQYAEKHLTEDQWSPEQIAGRLELEGMDTISHETIYQRILEDKNAGGTLYTHLRCKKKRKKRYGSARPTRGVIPNRVDIDQRPAIVESRKRTGDWEGDTIIGSHDGGAVIASMVERKSRFTVLAKSKNKTTIEVTESINQHMLPIADLVHTVTLDNGKEFSLHEIMAVMLNAKIYFAKPYHSWERGLNENTNGLVRQYFPKKIPFDNITNHELQRVAKKINDRPRKCLGYKTPYEVFSKSCEQRGIALRF
ncbi:MAG: IS30 family transposase [Gammaproteobacteria bacterium]|nr:IS30 family transposase [Gammaproteobacteria bacterium]